MDTFTAGGKPAPLFRRLELAFHTQYAELRERSRAEGPLLPGTPGQLTLRTGTGYGYWYRRYNSVPNQEVEDLVCRQAEEEAVLAMRSRIEFATWSQDQVRLLRKLGLQVADKDVSRLLVELHNKGLFESGLVVVGTMAFMALLNELGAIAVSAKTQDVDLARQQALKLGAPMSFLETVEGTKLKFFPVPGKPSSVPSTSVKRREAEGLRVDVLTHGEHLGHVVPLPELCWHAQTVPWFSYLLEDASQAAVLAGGHCVPVNLPLPERFVWHKLYASTQHPAHRRTGQGAQGSRSSCGAGCSARGNRCRFAAARSPRRAIRDPCRGTHAVAGSARVAEGPPTDAAAV